MQTKNAVLISALSLAFACTKANEAADDAIARSRSTLVDQVNPTGRGLPFFTPETLNPSWDSEKPVVRIPEMTWTDQNGTLRDRSLFSGKTSFVAFAFTSCSGFCPFVVQGLKKVAAGIKDPNAQFVVFTVDPEFDTPARLKSFAQTHDVDRSDWFFLRGKPAEVDSLIKTTFASQVFRKEKSSGRDFVHAGHFYLIDQDGRLRAILNGTEINVAQEGRRVSEALRAL